MSEESEVADVPCLDVKKAEVVALAYCNDSNEYFFCTVPKLGKPSHRVRIHPGQRLYAGDRTGEWLSQELEHDLGLTSPCCFTLSEDSMSLIPDKEHESDHLPLECFCFTGVVFTVGPVVNVK